VDETGSNLHIHRSQARSRRGEPAKTVVPTSNKGRNVIVFSAISHRGIEHIATHVSIFYVNLRCRVSADEVHCPFIVCRR
jgi:hypothetical protein